MDGARLPVRSFEAAVTVDKMVRIVSDADIIAAAIAKAEPELRRKIVGILASLRDERTIGEIAQLIRDRRIMEMLDDAKVAGAKIAEVVNEVYARAAKRIAEHLSARTGAFISVDQTHARVLQQIKTTRMQWVREISEQQRQIISDAVSEGIRAGKNPKATAKVIERSIGLTKHQYDHVKSYRKLLENLDAGALDRQLRDARFDRTIAGAVKAKQPLSAKQIDHMVARYEQRYIAFRARTIAQTEAIGAVHRGQHETWTQAVEQGDIKASEIQQSWAVGPARKHRREFHQSMRGQKRAWGVPFTSGRGTSLRYPHDENAGPAETLRCACVRVLRLFPGGVPKEGD